MYCPHSVLNVFSMHLRTNSDFFYCVLLILLVSILDIQCNVTLKKKKKKKPIFSYTTLILWLLQPKQSAFTVRYELGLQTR
jgi:hypothetical protein